MAHCQAAPRPERQRLAHAVVLGHRDWDGVGARGQARPDRGVADSEAADAPGRRQVALHQRRREREGAREVVEPVAGVVGGQQRLGIDVEGQEVADGVGVLGPVQAVRRHPARLDGRGGGAVELGLEPPAELVEGRPGGTRPAGRGHHAAAQLQDHPLPDVGRLADAGHVRGVESEPPRLQPLVVAGDAVPIEQDPLRRRRRGRCRLPRRRRRGAPAGRVRARSRRTGAGGPGQHRDQGGGDGSHHVADLTPAE